jgi:hypothetical protein
MKFLGTKQLSNKSKDPNPNFQITSLRSGERDLITLENVEMKNLEKLNFRSTIKLLLLDIKLLTNQFNKLVNTKNIESFGKRKSTHTL